MPILKLAVQAVSLVALATAASAEPKQIWSLDGFKNPESAIVDKDAGVIYVSNVDGGADSKDGQGSISRVSLDGRMLDAEWISGLDSPKGLALYGGNLYVADVDQLVEIDLKEGKVAQRYPAPGTKFLNDVAAGPDGHVYVTDMVTDEIWRLADGKFELWLRDEKLLNPNGVTVQGDRLIIAA